MGYSSRKKFDISQGNVSTSEPLQCDHTTFPGTEDTVTFPSESGLGEAESELGHEIVARSVDGR